jgi:hypothetical protein
MPAPRAVLADITDLGLNPTEKHTVYSRDGRLKPKVPRVENPVETPTVVEEVKTKKEVPIFVEEVVVLAPVEPVAEGSLEFTVVEEQTTELPVDVQAEVVEDKPKKKKTKVTE